MFFPWYHVKSSHVKRNQKASTLNKQINEIPICFLFFLYLFEYFCVYQISIIIIRIIIILTSFARYFCLSIGFNLIVSYRFHGLSLLSDSVFIFRISYGCSILVHSFVYGHLKIIQFV